MIPPLVLGDLLSLLKEQLVPLVECSDQGSDLWIHVIRQWEEDGELLLLGIVRHDDALMSATGFHRRARLCAVVGQHSCLTSTVRRGCALSLVSISLILNGSESVTPLVLV